MSERRLNHLLFLHIHKDLTDGLDLKNVLRSFCFASERREQDGTVSRSDSLTEPGQKSQTRSASGAERAADLSVIRE
ncbi:hypothetical protein NQZ68_008288 [Dissostichus eleginoides]|nr:hypothetical protein NQZ68_008288 [Dissostichus eleginoides]